MERYLRGEAPAPEDSAWSKSNVNFDAKKVIRRGQLEARRHDGALPGQPRRDLPQEGRHSTRRGRSSPWCSPSAPTTASASASGSAPPRSAAKPLDQIDYTGTAADPAALQEFLGHFQLCDGKG